jgi:hypothetical protein
VKVPSFYTSSTDWRDGTVDKAQRRGEVFKAASDGRKWDAFRHSRLLTRDPNHPRLQLVTLPALKDRASRPPMATAVDRGNMFVTRRRPVPTQVRCEESASEPRFCVRRSDLRFIDFNRDLLTGILGVYI